jgi:hypothetical protein
MPIRPQGRFNPGWNYNCWVHPEKKWVIYANGSTGKLPEHATINPQTGYWQWVEAGIAHPGPDNPDGGAIITGRPFQPGRAGGHLYAVPTTYAPGVVMCVLLNDVTGEESIGIYYQALQPGWFWDQILDGEQKPQDGKAVRKPHWVLRGTPKPNVVPENVPFCLNRAYPEWPPIYQPWRHG